MDRKEAEIAKSAEKKAGQGPHERREPSAHVNALSHAVIGAALDVHCRLGPGFLEAVYEEAVCVELMLRGIAFRRQVILPVQYKGRTVGESRLDLLVEDELVVELKAVEAILPVHLSQARSYLRAGEFQLALLINFNVEMLRDGLRRVVWTG